MFINAAKGMFSLIVDIKKVRQKASVVIKAEASSIEDLLVAWLRELLYHHSVKEMLFSSFEVKLFSEKRLEGRARGEAIDPSRHTIKREVKAATYHGLRCEKRGGGWEAEVIFDL